MATGQTFGTKKAGVHVTGVDVQQKTGCSQQPIQTTQSGTTLRGKAQRSSAKFNDIVVAARAELDDNKRRDMYAECQRLINDDGGTICPMFANYIIAHSKKVAHGARCIQLGSGRMQNC